LPRKCKFDLDFRSGGYPQRRNFASLQFVFQRHFQPSHDFRPVDWTDCCLFQQIKAGKLVADIILKILNEAHKRLDYIRALRLTSGPDCFDTRLRRLLTSGRSPHAFSLASGPPSGSFWYTASPLSYFRPVPPRPGCAIVANHVAIETAI